MIGWIFNRKEKSSAVSVMPDDFKRVYRLLNELGDKSVDLPIISEKSGFRLFSFLKRFFWFANQWAIKSDKGVGIAIGGAVGVATTAGLIEVGLTGKPFISYVAIIVIAFLSVLLGMVLDLAETKKERNPSIPFNIFLIGMIGLLISSFFISSFSVLPIAAALFWSSTPYFFAGLKGAFSELRKDFEVRSSLPATARDIHKMVAEKIKTTIQDYRSRAIASDSEFTKLLSSRENDLEKALLLIEKVKRLLDEGEDKDYANSRLGLLEATALEIKEDLNRLQAGKSEILEKLRVFESHLPVFDKIFNRLSLDDEIDALSQRAFGLENETIVFLEKELESLRSDIGILVEALEKTCILAITDKTPLFRLEENAEAIGRAVSETRRLLPA